MLKLFKKFRNDESGAVTVDWVVLTAAVIALAGVAYTQIAAGVNDGAGAISSSLGSISPNANIGSNPTN